MGAKKQWTEKKLAIMLQGLKDDCRVSELSNEHGIQRPISTPTRNAPFLHYLDSVHTRPC